MSVPTTGPTQATFAATLVDEWVRGGVRHAVVCPGSRSTPLALALSARSELQLHVRLDERSAGFFALGLGLDTGSPAIVCTTSGTAAAELHPSVVEAHHGRVPLVVCTADRPPELQQVGAPQTIDQAGLFGDAVRWHAEPGVPDPAGIDGWRPLAARSLAEAVHGPQGPGPVHLNLAFREPLVAVPGALPPGRAGYQPSSVVVAAPPPAAVLGDLDGWRGRTGVVVAGARSGPPEAVLELGRRLGWPVLADPRSGCRLEEPGVVAVADAFLRVPEVRVELLPEVVVLLGEPWTSKSLAELVVGVARAGGDVVSVDPWWRVLDPQGAVTRRHRADPGRWLTAALERLATGPVAPPPGWAERWSAVEAAARRALDQSLAADLAARAGALTEPALARHLLTSVPRGSVLFVGSSMPVRDLEWFGPPLAEPPTVLANRGANGIDGTVSTARGVAAAGRGPVVALLGDLAFLHDVSGLVDLGSEPPGPPCVLVVVDNAGGGIFSFLPQVVEVDRAPFERLFGTPPAVDLVGVATGFGLPVATAATHRDLDLALEEQLARPGPSVIRAVVPERDENAALHQALHQAVAAAARAAVAAPGAPERPPAARA